MDKQKTLNLFSVVIKNNQFFCKEIDNNNLLLLDPDEKIIHVMNEVGAFIWKNTASKVKVKDIAELLKKEYDLTQKKAEKDTAVFLKKAVQLDPPIFILT